MIANKNNKPLAVALFEKSVVKQAKFNNLCRYIGNTTGKRCLDLGIENGSISYFLRKRGGAWASADTDAGSVETARDVLKDEVYLIESTRTPFRDKEFDVIVIVDLIEHVHDDKGFVRELYRVLKKDGILLIHAPYRKSISLLRPFRYALGLTDEKHGHVRAGYTLKEMQAILPGGLLIEGYHTYFRSFLELMDIIISFLMAKLKGKTGEKSNVMVVSHDPKKFKKIIAVYACIYPFFVIVALLDKLLFFLKGYRMIVKTRKQS